MLRAIFFDFNGILVGDEPLHFRLFQKTLALENISLTEQDYYQKYLGFDDRDCFMAILKSAGISSTPPLLEKLIRTKAKLYEEEVKNQDLFITGAKQFVEQRSHDCFLGIVSGALKQEITHWLHRGNIFSYFQVIVAAEDIHRGKPDPEGYFLGLDQLNREYVPASEIILPQECLVLEDSIWGIDAAQEAGMKCLALTTSYTKHELENADWVYHSYLEIPWETILKNFV